MLYKGDGDIGKEEYYCISNGHLYLREGQTLNLSQTDWGHDYVLFNINTVTKNVWLRVRLIDVKSGNYLYRNDIATSGKTHNGRVLERSVANAMQEEMDDIKVSER